MTDEAIRVLVVDDEPTIAEFLKTGLRYEGYQIKTAADGRAAVQMAQEWRPQLVILDIMLPKLDGLAVCQRLRESQDLAIIMLTAKDEVEDKVHGLKQGADDYLTKPFSFVELLARYVFTLVHLGFFFGDQIENVSALISALDPWLVGILIIGLTLWFAIKQLRKSATLLPQAVPVDDVAIRKVSSQRD